VKWYWLFAAMFLLLFFVSNGHSFSQVFYFISFLLPVVIGTAYYVNTKLIPEFLVRKKTGLFVLYLIYTIIISLYLHYLIVYLAVYFFSIFQLGNENLLTMKVSSLSLILYILVLVKVALEIGKKLMQKDMLIKKLESKQLEPIETAQKLTVRYNRENHTINTDDIIFIESLSDYIKIVTQEDEIVTKERISKIIDRLPKHFIRTHRSFIVNTKKIKSFNREFITLKNHQIPISRTYKTSVLGFLEKESA